MSSFGTGAEAALEDIVAFARREITAIVNNEHADEIAELPIEARVKVLAADRQCLVTWGNILLSFVKNNVSGGSKEAQAKSMDDVVRLLGDDEEVAKAFDLPPGMTVADAIEMVKGKMR